VAGFSLLDILPSEQQLHLQDSQLQTPVSQQHVPSSQQTAQAQLCGELSAVA
jgi:hypothetical protein